MHLEKYKNKFNIYCIVPSFLIIVNGGKNELKKAAMSVSKKIPVLVIAVSSIYFFYKF